MSINSIVNAQKYSEELDRVFAQKSATGFFADNALAAKFVGAKTVIIPDIDFQGLADYDRNNGYSKGAITVSNTSHTMSMDRARSLQIDREDMDETGIANLAGKILGEYVRTKVVPECDAYVLSKLAGIAIDRGNISVGSFDEPVSALYDLICKVQEAVGYDEELVAFVDSPMYAHMQSSEELSKMITISDFKQGDVNLTVKSLNGVAIIPVLRERMKTEYTFDNTDVGGFAPTDIAKDIYMLVCPKSCVHLVKKTESMRIFTPEQNLDADAYKFDYRIYYDAFVNKSGLDSIFAWVSPDLEIITQPKSAKYSTGMSATVVVSAESNASIYYQWYSCTDENGSNPKKLEGENERYHSINNMPDGVYHYFVRVYADEITYIDSDVVTITIGNN